MDRVNVINELRKLQKRDKWLTDAGLAELSKEIGRPVHELYGVASFYPEFHLKAPPRVTIRVCTALPCQMQGSERLMQQTLEKAAKQDDVLVVRAPCLGACDAAPVATINERLERCNGGKTIANLIDVVNGAIGKAQPADGAAQPADGIAEVASVEAAHHEDAGPTAFPTVVDASVKPAIVRAGHGPFKTDPYPTPGERYGAIRKLVNEHPDGFPEFWKVLKAGNLRGMGGSGAEASRKWQQVAEAPGDEKFVVCNADESEPGTLKDRELLKALPHLLVEGMAIAALSIGARQGYIYLRHEYHEQYEALVRAIAEAYAAGVLGANAAGSGRTFDLEVFVSPGGYVLGEITALLEALEGKRGQPRNQIVDLGINLGIPSYNGLWGKPTIVNNVETYIYVPFIVMRGPDGFKDQGVNGSQGLKWASVCGDVVRPGVYEVPMGTRYRDMIEMAGGVIGGWEQFKAFAPSGPTVGFRPPADVDQVMDFPDKRNNPTNTPSVGSGAIIVLDKSRCMVDAALNFTRFFRNESCGKCVPCRAGSNQSVTLIKQVRGRLLSRQEAETRARAAARAKADAEAKAAAEAQASWWTKLRARRLAKAVARAEARALSDEQHDKKVVELPYGKEEAAKLLSDFDHLADLMTRGSICGLGKVVAVPFQTVQKYWPEEVDAHLTKRKCLANFCVAPLKSEVK